MTTSESKTATKLAALLSRQDIADVIYRYARGVDRLDLDLIRSCFHPDAYDDHGTFQGGIDAFIGYVADFLPRYATTMHFMGNMLIEVEGPLARAETYAVAYHRQQLADGSGRDDVFGIRYVDRFEERPTIDADGTTSPQWRIAHRIVVTEWRRVDPVPVGKVRGGVGAWGRRDQDDALYHVLSASPAPR